MSSGRFPMPLSPGTGDSVSALPVFLHAVCLCYTPCKTEASQVLLWFSLSEGIFGNRSRFSVLQRLFPLLDILFFVSTLLTIVQPSALIFHCPAYAVLPIPNANTVTDIIKYFFFIFYSVISYLQTPFSYVSNSKSLSSALTI